MSFLRAASAAALFGAASMTFAGCSVSTNNVREAFHQSVPAANVSTIGVDDLAGRVRISTWNKPQIAIDGIKSASSEETVKSMQLQVATSGRTLNVSMRYPDSIVQNGGVEYDIRVPAGTNVNVKTEAGEVLLDGMTADVTATTQAGRIAVTLAKLGGNQNVDLHTTVGEVVLRIPKKSDATFDTAATIGEVNNSFGSRAGSGSAHVTARTTTGRISIQAE